MSESIFNIVQFGQQGAGDTTPATVKTIFPADAGVVIDEDRAPASPDEDYGENAVGQPGRGTYGLRGPSIGLSGEVRAEDFMDLLEMSLSHATKTGSAPAVTWPYTADLTSDTCKRYTIEGGVVGTADDQWRAVGCVVDTLEWGFDALTAPGNTPWKFNAGIVGLYRERSNLTGGCAAPTVAETFEGHLTRLYEGPTSTAYASLAEAVATIKSIKFNLARNRIRRAYGGANDYASAWGQSARKAMSFTAEVAINATTHSDISDVYENAGSLMLERRWRVQARGSAAATANEVQTFTTNADLGGTFTLSFEGATTTPLAFDATTGTVQTALRALATMLGVNPVVVTGAAGAWIVTFSGASMAAKPQLLMQYNDSLLTKTVPPVVSTMVRTTPGGPLKTLTHDFRCRFHVVNVGNIDGERVFTVEGITVKDPAANSGTTSDMYVAILNGIETNPSA
jgi:hypothetical protein